MTAPGRPKCDYRNAQHESTPVSGHQALLGIGQVHHLRLRPVRHGFTVPTYFLLLPLRTLRHTPSDDLARNRFAPIAFHDRDHGDGRDDCLAWLDDCLRSEGIADADGEVWLHCYPRVLGYVFKPVSFWYCQRADGSLAAVVVEVNNTFGERHCYLLAGPALAFGAELAARKVFHVSPFCHVTGDYRFRFLRSDSHIVARIDHHDADGALLLTHLSGTLAAATRARQRRAFFTMPLMTLGVIVRIHWQALRLLAKRLPLVRKPAAPGALFTR